MNEDHPDDCVTMVRGLGGVDASSATMTDLDELGADFEVVTGEGTSVVRLPWSRRLTERAEVRTEVVAMHERACRELGIQRPT